MELQQLRYFDEVARTQHVTNSAKKLNVAQPALTQSIRRLERELGVTLFERVGRNVRLTACGDALQKVRTVRAESADPRARRFFERIGIAVPAERASQEPLPLSDLADEPFICLAGSRTFRAVCDEACAHAGFVPRVAFESDSPAVVKNMIGLGLGVGFWPERSWGGLDDSSARLASIADAPFARTIEIAPTSGPLSKEAAAFHGFLVSFFEERWREPSPLCS